MLPFKQCAQIEACNPLKLREYLAAGKPVVTTDFPALAPYRSVVSVATDKDAFVRGLLATETDNQMAVRRGAVREQTWQAQARKVHTWLEAL